MELDDSARHDGGQGVAAGRLVDVLHGDHAQVRCALAQLLGHLVDLRLVLALRGREVL